MVGWTNFKAWKILVWAFITSNAHLFLFTQDSRNPLSFRSAPQDLHGYQGSRPSGHVTHNLSLELENQIKKKKFQEDRSDVGDKQLSLITQEQWDKLSALSTDFIYHASSILRWHLWEEMRPIKQWNTLAYKMYSNFRGVNKWEKVNVREPMRYKFSHSFVHKTNKSKVSLIAPISPKHFA